MNFRLSEIELNGLVYEADLYLIKEDYDLNIATLRGETKEDVQNLANVIINNACEIKS